jgi:hypothetical protein
MRRADMHNVGLFFSEHLFIIRIRSAGMLRCRFFSSLLNNICNRSKLDCIFAEPRYSTDNALGIAVLTYLREA